jgi:CubicO group peptidase (beta-lactamase class C family)
MKIWKDMTAGLCTAALALSLAPAGWADEWQRVAPEEVGMSADRLQRLTDVMQGYVDSGDIPGMVVLIARDGKVPYLETFGYQDLETRTPMAEDTIFRIASQTKALISAGIMVLHEQGKLLLDDPLSNFLPEWGDATVAVPLDEGGFDIVPVERPITIRDMLTHTSGIPYGGWRNPTNADVWSAAGFDGWYLASRERSIREVVRAMARLPIAAQPGQGWLYGYNTDILGAVIEVASEQTLDAFLAQTFFDPLGMEDTQFWLPEAEAARLATVYDRSGPGELVKAPEEPGMWTQGDYVVGQGPNMTLSGGAGLLSTAEDYSIFLEMLRNGGRTMDGEQILSPASVQLMTVDHLGEALDFRPGEGFGLGFAVTLDPGVRGVLSNEGEFRWGGAYHTTYWVDPEEDLVVAAFTQMGETSGIDDQGKLRALVYQAIVD